MMKHDPWVFLFFALFSFVGLFFISCLFHVTFRQRKTVSTMLQHSPSLLSKVSRWCCPDASMNCYLFCLTCARYLLCVFYIVLFTIGVIELLFPSQTVAEGWGLGILIVEVVGAAVVLIGSLITFSDILPRSIAFTSPDALLRFIKSPAEFFLALLSPFVFLICRTVKLILPQDPYAPFSELHEQLLDLIGRTEGTWTDHDKRLLQSVLNFRNRIAREIMRPRVELFCIPENLPLDRAAELLQREGYSRVPVYRDTIDTIVGVLFYKDVLSKYAAAAEAGKNRDQLLHAPVKTLVKKAFYCPETKKIASLLQEFRKRQSHLAVVVDEYGGTAGLVTIEDILEEIVGEIADEYDDQEVLFSPAPGGGWIVDARMNLLDVEEELGVIIPQEEDYDTLAGYIFYRVGSIPQAGLVLHHDAFEIEILKSNDRMVEEVKITPTMSESDIPAHTEEG